MNGVERDLPRRTWVEQIMDMPVSVLARGEAARSDAAAAAVNAAFDDLRDVDALFSTYRPDSAVSRINRAETTVAASRPEVRDVARRCVRSREVTAGLFDATRPDGTWDASGLVKGWAVERGMRHLAHVPRSTGAPTREETSPSSAGAVDLSASASRPARSRGGGRARGLHGWGLATSGTAARGPHLYDPLTGSAAGGPWLSVSVLGPSLELADVRATAAFVAGGGWSDVLRRMAGDEGMAVAADGSLAWTSVPRTGASA